MAYLGDLQCLHFLSLLLPLNLLKLEPPLLSPRALDLFIGRHAHNESLENEGIETWSSFRRKLVAVRDIAWPELHQNKHRHVMERECVTEGVT